MTHNTGKILGKLGSYVPQVLLAYLVSVFGERVEDGDSRVWDRYLLGRFLRFEQPHFRYGFHAIVHHELIRSRGDDKQVLLHELVSEDRPYLLKTCCGHAQFESVRSPEVEVGEQARVVLSYIEPNFYTVGRAFVDIVDQLVLALLLWLERFKADPVRERYLCIALLANGYLPLVDFAQDLALGHCQDDLVPESQQLHLVAVQLKEGRRLDVSALSADLGLGCGNDVLDVDTSRSTRPLLCIFYHQLSMGFHDPVGCRTSIGELSPVLVFILCQLWKIKEIDGVEVQLCDEEGV